MQIAYMLSMFLVIMAFALIGLDRSSDPVEDQSLALIEQMSAWHKAAIRVCANSTCATGTIDPRSRLPQLIRDGNGVTSFKFRTRYDSSQKVLVTHLDNGFLSEGGPTYGTVAAAISDKFKGDESSGVGQFDGSSNEVVPNYTAGYSPGAVIRLPGTIAGLIPDGAPVIATRM